MTMSRKKNKPESWIDMETGIWLLTDEYDRRGRPHCFFDSDLSSELVSFFKEERSKTIADMGCGWARYTKDLRKNGLSCDGFDGNPNVHSNTGGLGKLLDLSKPVVFETKYDWILSLEVGEHIPKEYERIFINNLHENSVFGIVLSWAIPGQRGAGHFNERSNAYIKDVFSKLGYKSDLDQEIRLRKAASVRWFKNGLMVFRK
tara:strand:- start:9801 stop:10409 length:609 start_codon:yes stop_codon:yes gene_type:complete